MSCDACPFRSLLSLRRDRGDLSDDLRRGGTPFAEYDGAWPEFAPTCLHWYVWEHRDQEGDLCVCAGPFALRCARPPFLDVCCPLPLYCFEMRAANVPF